MVVVQPTQRNYSSAGMHTEHQPEQYAQYYQLQRQLAHQVITTDDHGPINYVAGADVAYDDDHDRAIGAIVVLDARTLEVVDEAVYVGPTAFPYIPGLFSFREVPPLIGAFRALEVKPDMIVCDGHGLAHPKRFGMACHLGIELDIPTIGCAKRRLVGTHDSVPELRGSYATLNHQNQLIGRVLRTQDGVKPLYVSAGHLVSLETACEWVLKLSPNYRQPETTRAADALVRARLQSSRLD